MGWKKYKRNIKTGLKTTTPSREKSEECRTPTPVKGSGDQEVEEDDKAPQSGDVPTPGSRSTCKVDGLHGSPTETSFSDHLQSLVEDYTREIISKDRQLREVRKQKHEMYIEFWNYKLSWTMDRAEMVELRAQLEEERKGKERMHAECMKLAEEHSKVQEQLDAILKENGQARYRSTRSSVEEEDQQPRIHAQVKVQRRDAQLPPIAENNKIVKSSVAPSRSES